MKKLVSLVLALLLSIAMLTPAFASGNVSDALVREKITNSLAMVEENKENIGLTNVDFSELRFGEEIKMYECTAAGFNELRSCYPLFYDDDLIAFAIENNNQNFQIATQLAQKINLMQLDELAIVYDNVGVYAYDGKTLRFVMESSIQVDGRTSIPDVSQLQNTSEIVLADLEDSTTLSFSSSSSSNARNGVMATCPISHVSQPTGSLICWAAVIASIVNYRTGTSYSAIDIAQNYYGESYNYTLANKYVAGVLGSYGVTGYSFNEYTVPDAVVIYNNLNSGYPLYGFFSYGSTIGHVGTIFSIHMFDGYIVVMDPEVTSYQYCEYENGAFSYIREDVGLTLTLTCAACRYWS